MRGVRYWEIILKRLSYLGLNVSSAIHGMSAIWDVRYWDVSLHYQIIIRSVHKNNNFISTTQANLSLF